MTRILVTGASGLLGLNFALTYSRRHQVTGVVNAHSLTGTPFQVLNADLAKPGSIGEILDRVKPDVVLHCAALANVDQCERQPELAWRLNADLPEEVAQATANRGIVLVHISTDAVFDGKTGGYTEESQPNPLGAYARTKLAAEHAVLRVYPEALIARVNFYGWSLGGQRSLAEFFFNHLSAGTPVRGFTDVFFCPLEVTVLAETLMRLVGAHCSGIYHVVSGECLSKYEFGCAVARRFGLDEGLIQPVSVHEGGLLAARSPDLRLRTDKLAGVLGSPAPDQKTSMQRFFELYQAGHPQQLRALAFGVDSHISG